MSTFKRAIAKLSLITLLFWSVLLVYRQKSAPPYESNLDEREMKFYSVQDLLTANSNTELHFPPESDVHSTSPIKPNEQKLQKKSYKILSGPDMLKELNPLMKLRSSSRNVTEAKSLRSKLSWADFVSLPAPTSSTPNPLRIHSSVDKFRCSTKIIDSLSAPLSSADHDWCVWALSPSGGKVQVSPLN